MGCVGGAINSPLAVAGGPTLVVASRDNRLRGYDLSGCVLWNIVLPGLVLGAPVIDEDGAIYLGISENRGPGDNRGMLLCLTPSRSGRNGAYETDAAVESTPVIGDDGLVYFGDNRGTVHAVDVRGGRSWTENVGAEVRSPGAVLGKGLLAFGTDDGRLVVLRCSSERLRGKGWPKFRGTPEQNGMLGQT